MRWLAIILLTINVGLWYYADTVGKSSRSNEEVRGTLPRVSSLKVPEDTAALQPSPVAALYCVRVGWFESEQGAQAAADSIGLGQGQSVTIERDERERPPLHWVLIPPQPVSQARKQFRDIQSRGIDSYLVTEGQNRYAISLGLFQSEAAAISVLDEKKRQNLNAVLAIFPRNQISYALVFEAGYLQSSEDIRAVKADYQRNFDLVEFRRCEGVATPKKNP